MQKYEKINLIDVGCAGYMPSPWNKEGYGSYVDNLLSIDLLDDELQYLDEEFSDSKKIMSKNIIFDQEEERDFYICKRSRVSSLFKPNMSLLKSYLEYLNKIRKPKIYNISKYNIERVDKVKCIRLETVLDELDIDFDFLKIDTEGGDPQVIKSLGKYLDTQIIVIHAELYFKELYKDIILFDDVNKFLFEHNFYPAKILNGVDNYWANFLYIRYDPSKKNKINLIKKAYNINEN
jgi:FkbM family methyltransferase